MRWLLLGMAVLVSCGSDDDDHGGSQGASGGSTGAGAAATGGGGQRPEPTGDLLWHLILPGPPENVTFAPEGSLFVSAVPCGSLNCLAKLDPNGTELWSKELALSRIDATSDGGVVAAGAQQGQHDFGGGLIGDPTGVSDVVVRYDGSGTHVWSKAFPSGGFAHQVAVDAADNVFVAGDFTDSIAFGATTLVSTVEAHAFVAKLGPNGDVVFARLLPTYAFSSLAPDEEGGVFVAADISASFDFGGGTLALPAGSPQAAYIARFDSSGNHSFSSLVVHASGIDYHQQLALAPDGDVVLAHSFWTEPGPADFGEGPVTSDDIDAFAIRFSPDGARRWVKTYTAPRYQYIRAAAVDPFGDLVVGGDFAGSIDVGGGPILGKTDTSTGHDLFLAKLDGSGQHIWSQAIRGNRYVELHSIAIDVGGRIAIAGRFEPNVDFGGGLGGSGNGGFVAMFAP